jgi:hypothetical protein
MIVSAMESPPPISPPAGRLRRSLKHAGNFVQGLWGLCWLALTFMTIIWDYWRSRYFLNRWAADNAFKLLHREYRILRRGPFLRAPRRGHTVHYITVRDRAGALHTGYARCGRFWRAVTSGAVEVKWDTLINLH